MIKLLKLFLIFPLFCFSQNGEMKIDTVSVFDNSKIIHYTPTGRNCEDGNQRAITDFKNGIYNYYTYGFTTSVFKNGAEIKKYLKEKYSINYEHNGCIVFEDEMCYMDTMTQLVEEKFGKNYFYNKLEEARKKISKVKK